MFEVDEDMIVYAFRYALGRMTYAVSTVSDFLVENWHRFKPHTKETIIEQIQEAIDGGIAGAECDVRSWQRILLLEKADGEENK